MPDILAAIAAVCRFLATTDGAIPIVGAICLLSVGTALTGHGASVERTRQRTSYGDKLILERHIPARHAIARTFLGRSFGVLLTTTGLMLFCYGLVSCAAPLHWP